MARRIYFQGILTALPFLGEGPQLAHHSEKTAETLDEELMTLLAEAYSSNLDLLRTHQEALGRLAERLLKDEKLEQSDLTEILGPRPGPDTLDD